MTIQVISEEKLDEGSIVMIRSIMQQSSCPNETLLNSIPLCKGIVDGIIVIGTRAVYIEEITY